MTDIIQTPKVEEKNPTSTLKRRATLTTIPLHPRLQTSPKSNPLTPKNLSMGKVVGKTTPVTPKPTAEKKSMSGRKQNFLNQATPETNNTPEPDESESSIRIHFYE